MKTLCTLLLMFVLLSSASFADEVQEVKRFSKHSTNPKLVKMLTNLAWNNLYNAKHGDSNVIPEAPIEAHGEELLPLEMRQYVIDRGVFAVAAEWCGFGKLNNGYLTLIAEEKASEKWTEEQLSYITELHKVSMGFFEPRFANMPECNAMHKRSVELNF